jgi:hypothetical protein
MQDIQNKLISFQNLLVVASVDERIPLEEKEFLVEVGVRYGLKPMDLKSLVEAECLDFQLHDKFEDNLQDLGDMLTVAAADGIILAEETAECKRFATLAGIPPFKFEELLQIALNQIEEDMEEDFKAGNLTENP